MWTDIWRQADQSSSGDLPLFGGGDAVTDRPEIDLLLLSDERPGHYHLADGVVAAMARIADVTETRLKVRRRRFIPMRFLRWLVARTNVPPETILWLGYGRSAADLDVADIVISAGGETLVANIAVARAIGAANIFCGSLRSLPPELFTLIVTSYARFANRPRHLVTLKPSAVDPDALGRPKDVPVFNAHNPPARAGLLIGGNSGLFHYERDEWERLFTVLEDINRAWGTKWHVSTSRRTDDWVGDAVADLAAKGGAIERFIDYRNAGPGTLSEIFRAADIIVCTEDSSTMLSEAISARLPVIGVAPSQHAFKPEEAEYRQFLLENGWCRGIEIEALDVPAFEAVLGEIKPLDANPLDKLAADIKGRLTPQFWQ